MRIGTLWPTLLTLLSVSLGLASPVSGAEPDRVVVFAAASLKTALGDIAKAWQRDGGPAAAISYAGSSALARQIEQGAPADVFISADRDWMNYLESKNVMAPASRVDLLGNRLVLIAPKGKAQRIEIAAPFDLAKLLAGGKLAMANVTSVPAGKYGKAALMAMKAWGAAEKHVAQADNVRAALALVARGEAALGVVYATDAKAEPGVEVIGVFPESSHPPIVYPFALTRAGAQNASARAFLAHVQRAQARTTFEANGFSWKGP